MKKDAMEAGSLDPADLIDDLRAELMAVEPSPRFAAGVRARIAADRSPRTVLHFSAAALSVAAVWAFFAAGVPRQPIRTVSAPQAAHEPTAVESSERLPPAVVRRAPSAVVRAPQPSEPATPAPFAESHLDVLVPSDQSIALQQLLQWHAAGRQLRLARDGHAVNWFTGTLMQQRPVEIPLVTIEPLPGGEPGVGGKLK